MTLTKGDFGPPFLFCGLNGILWKTGLGEVVGQAVFGIPRLAPLTTKRQARAARCLPAGLMSRKRAATFRHDEIRRGACGTGYGIL